MIFGMGMLEILIVLAPLVLLVIPAWRIVSKAGYAGVWSLLLLIPGVNFIAFFAFAFSEWPLERSVESVQRAPSTRPV